jgi:hypothetical protein
MDKTQRKIPACGFSGGSYRLLPSSSARPFHYGFFSPERRVHALVSGTFNFGDLSDQLWI